MPDKPLAFLKDLIELPGLSAYEKPVRERIRAEWEPLVDELSTSQIGSLHGHKHGSADPPRPSILVATHMDAIGMMVTEVVEGLLRVTEVGGLDPRILPGLPVLVHGRRDLPGVIVQPPPSSRPRDADDGTVPLEELMVDVGLSPRQVGRLVRSGDLVSFAQAPIELSGQLLAGHSLDNRASVAALTVCLQELQARDHSWDVLAVATVQEEETLGGAKTSAYALQPSMAIAVDVTFGRSPGVPAYRTFELGKGPTCDWGPNIHPALHEALKRTAEEQEIPVSVDVIPGMTGTDAFALQISREGIPTAGIGIPLRYMHTSVETVSLVDVRRAGRLLAAFIAGLQPDFLDEISWD